ncbi:MAG: tRNA threonylcarbamoyladenosine dehydratase [Coriobacteriia bacterium]|nr:tRNA threonylcarbamoyladenosine dehydratase [Coriobacteriia bacterium]
MTQATPACQHERTRLLIGNGVDTLARAHVAVFGVGGVGGFAVEALARAGVGTLDLIDKDCVDETNINRQIIALHSTIGQDKVEVAKRRIHDINPQAQVNTHRCFFLPENADEFDFSQYDYIIDAVDTVSAKLALIERAKAAGTPVISAMGAGNKLDPTRFEVADISKTSVCPLAKVMRRELKKRGIHHVKVVYSQETPRKPQTSTDEANMTPDPAMPRTKQSPGSISFVPSVVGLIIASEVVKDLIH